MGRHSVASKRQAEKEKEFIEGDNDLRRQPNQKFEEGTGERFNVKVTRCSNGFIITSQQGEQMVFSDGKYEAAMEWIISRRLKQMNPGEEMELLIEQRFTKICKTKNTDNSQHAA